MSFSITDKRSECAQPVAIGVASENPGFYEDPDGDILFISGGHIICFSNSSTGAYGAYDSVGSYFDGCAESIPMFRKLDAELVIRGFSGE